MFILYLPIPIKGSAHKRNGDESRGILTIKWPFRRLLIHHMSQIDNLLAMPRNQTNNGGDYSSIRQHHYYLKLVKSDIDLAVSQE